MFAMPFHNPVTMLAPMLTTCLGMDLIAPNTAVPTAVAALLAAPIMERIALPNPLTAVFPILASVDGRFTIAFFTAS